MRGNFFARMFVYETLPTDGADGTALWLVFCAVAPASVVSESELASVTFQLVVMALRMSANTFWVTHATSAGRANNPCQVRHALDTAPVPGYRSTNSSSGRADTNESARTQTRRA